MMSWFFTHLPKTRSPLFGSSPMTILNIWLKHLVELQLEIGLWCCKLIFIVQGGCLVTLLENNLLLCIFTTLVAQVHYLAGTINVQVSHMRFWHAMTDFIVREQKLNVFESEMLRRIFQLYRWEQENGDYSTLQSIIYILYILFLKHLNQGWDGWNM